MHRWGVVGGFAQSEAEEATEHGRGRQRTTTMWTLAVVSVVLSCIRASGSGSELVRIIVDVVLFNLLRGVLPADRLPDPERGDPLLAGLDLGARVQRQLVRIAVLEQVVEEHRLRRGRERGYGVAGVESGPRWIDQIGV